MVLPAAPRSAGDAARWRPRWSRPDRGGVAVALVLAAAGLLFSITAQTAGGTQLRPERLDSQAFYQGEERRLRERQAEVDRLRAEVDDLTATAARGSGTVDALQAEVTRLSRLAGVEPVRGPGLTVSLDDAPHQGSLPDGITPDDLVVHQQDVQAVVNALWAGGAEAMMVQDQRIIATSAVRCVGNTLILQGRVYSPPFRITAVGDVARMQASLDRNPTIMIYREFVNALGLGYEVRRSAGLSLPGYTGPLSLRYVAGAGSEASGTRGASVSSGTTSGSGTQPGR